MTIDVVDRNRGGLGVQPDDDADTFAQMLVGEADCVANEELLTLRSRRWRRFKVERMARCFWSDRGV